MGEQATITAKIPIEHKEKLRKHGVNVNRLIIDAIARKVHRLSSEELLMLRFGAIVLSPKPKAFAYRWWSGD